MDAYFFGQRKAVPAAFEEWLTPKLSAAVSIDMHRGHLDDSPECPCPAPRAREIIEPINKFHRECRRLGVPVIHVKTVLRASGVDDTGATRRRGGSRSRSSSARSPTRRAMGSRGPAGPSS
jgi:biuret amidohydrolase